MKKEVKNDKKKNNNYKGKHGKKKCIRTAKVIYDGCYRYPDSKSRYAVNAAINSAATSEQKELLDSVCPDWKQYYPRLTYREAESLISVCLGKA